MNKSIYITKNGATSWSRGVRIPEGLFDAIYLEWSRQCRKFQRLSLNDFLLLLIDLGLQVWESSNSAEQLRLLALVQNRGIVPYAPPPDITSNEQNLTTLLRLTGGRRTVRLAWFARKAGYSRADDKDFVRQLQRLRQDGVIIIQQGGYAAHSKEHPHLVHILADALWFSTNRRACEVRS